MRSTSKKEEMRVRVISIAGYVISENCTVREASKMFNVSKSTVHKDLTDRLRKLMIDDASLVNLYNGVRKVLDKNKAERAYRGGQATKWKYSIIKNK